MPYRFNRDSEIRSTLRRLHEILDRGLEGSPHLATLQCRTGAEAVLLQLAEDLGTIYDTSFLDLDEGDSFGESEYNAMMLDGCMKLLGFTSHEEMERAIRQNTPAAGDDR